MKKLSIFLTAYDVNPFRGSEAGMGWNFAFHISQYERVHLVTRKNNKADIDLWISQNTVEFSTSELHVSYFDLPEWALKFKSGARFWAIYYYFWQFFLALHYRKEIRSSSVAHALNFHSDLFPSFLWIFNRNFFWGPINHHEKTPADQLVLFEGYIGLLKDRASWILKLLNWRLNPLLLACQWKSRTVFCGSSAVLKRWRGPKKGTKFVNLSSVGISRGFIAKREVENTSQASSSFTLLSIGRFVSMKSFELTILAYKRFLESNPSVKNTRLVLIGQGPNIESIQRCVQNIPGNGAVEVLSWVAFSDIAGYFSRADIFVFPSHEGAGMVVAEALIAGLPVLCLNNNGPSELAGRAGIPVNYNSFDSATELLADEIERLYHDKRYLEDLCTVAKEEAKRYFWDAKAMVIAEEYRDFIFLDANK